MMKLIFKAAPLFLLLVICLGPSLIPFSPFSLKAKEVDLSELKNRWSGTYEATQEGHYTAIVASKEAPSYIEKKFEEPQSFDRKFVRLKLRVSDLKRLSGIELRLSSEPEGYNDFFSIPIPLFTDPQFNIIQSDSWLTYTFTMGEAKVHGAPNIHHIERMGFYLGGEKVDIDFKKLSIEEAFPESIVTFTFDDNYDDHFLAAEIMAKYNLRGTAYVMPRQVNQKNYLTVNQIRMMKEDMGWDISSHHKTPIVDFPYHELDNEFNYTLGYLNALGSFDEALHFAYPLGKQDRKLTLPLVRRTFNSARIAGGGAETLPPADWHMLRTFNVMPHISPEEILERARLARAQGEWLILMFHYLTPEENPSNPLEYNIEKFDELCRLLSEEGLNLMTVNDVYREFHR